MSAALAPRRSLGRATAAFFEANLRHIKGPLIGQPYVLDDWQVEDFELMLEVDDRGLPVWREILYGVPRGMGKSPGAAGIALTDLASFRDKPEIYVGSGSRDQAAIVGEFAREMAKTGPLEHWTRPIIGGVRWDGPGGGSIKVISADGGLQHGKSPKKIVLDELHVFTTPRREELYNSQVSSLHKRADSQLLGITTAGFSRLTLLGELYDAMLGAPVVERTGDMGCRLVCEDRENGRLMIWWGAPDDSDIEDPAVWAACNPASWIGFEEISRMARTQPRGVFQRLHLNMWTESSSVVVRPEAWSACATTDALEPTGGTVLALSASPRRDSAALVAVWHHGERIACRMVEQWEGVEQGDLELAVIESAQKWASAHRVDAFVADPIQLDTAYRALAPMGEYRGKTAQTSGMPQTDAYMEPATACLASIIESKRLIHGDDAALRRHVMGAEATDTRRGWRLARPKPVGERKAQSVEGAIALSMGVYALDQGGGAPGFSWGDE